MKKLIISIFTILIPSLIFGQVFDNFEDGDFTNNPTWTGNQDRFQVNSNFQLQLNHEGEASISSLQTSNQLVDSTSWEFYIKQSFSPSSNNNARVYLVSNQEDLQGSLNGYFLQFGESGSSDAIELFKQEGDVLTSICRGSEGAISSSFNAKIKVVHKQNDLWMVYSDFNNSGSFTLECQGNDGSFHSTVFFGFYCKYTSSNSTKFYFDDIEIKYLEVDVQAPKVDALVVLDRNKIRVTYSELVEEESVENQDHYLVNSGIGNPHAADLEANQLDVVLEFSTDFIVNQDYQITVGGAMDLSGNMMQDTVITFSRNELKEYDVVFNEIMADPSPVVQLPNAEYLEIYNRSNGTIDLSGWTLQIGTTEKDFPSITIPSKGYLILCKSSNVELLSAYGICAGFSSFSLTNSGQSLTLISPDAQIIHSITYTDDWYADPDKDDGGWSIEQIRSDDFCSEEGNWKASIDVKGGSPGAVNSVYDPAPVSAGIKSLEITDNPLLLLTYTQNMNMEHILNKEIYSVTPNIGQPSQVIMVDTSTSVYLSFNQPFEEGVEYNFIINGLVHNCADEGMEVPAEKTFMLNKLAAAGDVIINEIMADPDPVIGLPNHEYLELYNTASSPIDLSDWILQIGSSSKTIEDFILPSHSYVLICKNDAIEALSQYGMTYGLSSFSLTNSGTQLVLMNKDGGIIHQVEYSDSWYQDDEKKEGGWSLETIDPIAYCIEESNWGASIDASGGTPGAINSIDGLAPEQEDLLIERIELMNSSSIRVYFSRKMDSASLSVPLYYSIDQGMGNPTECLIEGPKYKTVRMTLSESLQEGLTYTLETLDGLKECNGNDAAGLIGAFAIPAEVEAGDIVFNEILFDSHVDDGEYIELVNISDKILETSSLSISRIKINEYDTSWYTANLSGNLLFPGDYAAYTSSASQVLKVYDSEAPEKIYSLSSFPSLPNTEGIILLHLSSSKDSIIDRLDYDESWHYSLLNNTKGVSLEKMDLKAGNNQENWHSAASSVNYGTPAYQNSQFQEEGQTASKFELVPEIFSPDNDGVDDMLQINYQMDEAGYTLNLVIYDSRGRKIKHLVKNELLASSGSFYWDGQDEDYQKAHIGIYILFFEYFDLSGNVKSEKLTVVLGGRL
jgi:hypothetical protein